VEVLQPDAKSPPLNDVGSRPQTRAGGWRTFGSAGRTCLGCAKGRAACLLFPRR